MKAKVRDLIIIKLNAPFRACLYGGELPLVGGLPSPQSLLWPSVYMRKVVTVDRAKTCPPRLKDWRELL